MDTDKLQQIQAHAREIAALLYSNSKFRTILRRSSDRPNYQELLSSLGVRLSEPSNFEFGIAACCMRKHPPSD